MEIRNYDKVKRGGNMLGAIIGDKAGSNYEMEEINYWKEYKNLDHTKKE